MSEFRRSRIAEFAQEHESQIRIVLTVVCGLSLALGFFSPFPWPLYVAIASGSVHALRSSWQSIAARTVDVNVLMVLAAAGSMYLNMWKEAATLLFLFTLSGTLEDFALSKTKSAIEGLMKLRPETALRTTPEGDEEVVLKWLRVGDVVRVRPFDAFPIDGEVVEGTTDVDQSAMTGESRPVVKTVGDRVLAGTTNGGGMVLVQVTATSDESTLEKIVALVRDAQENKASGERISSWFGTRYTLFVIGAFAVSLVVRTLLGQEGGEALYYSLTLFVALSPCAIVISTPASTLSALAWCAGNGILVRGGKYIELVGKTSTAIFDKTGTLTVGKPQLAQICVCQTSMAVAGAGAECAERDACWRHGETMSLDAKDILKIAASAEQYSSHPIAEAVVSAARAQGIAVPEAEKHEAVAGFGVRAIVENKNVRVGQRRFFEIGEESLPAHFAEHVEDMQLNGMTVAIVEYDGDYAALGLEDTPREEASAVLKQLRDLGVSRQILATGDTKQTAQAIASRVGVTEVYAALLPDDKEALVARLEDEGTSVMMVGDGINDAPSLARSSVGVAMGGLGSDVALNAADVVLMQDRLDVLPSLIKVGRKANRIIRQNLAFGTGVIAVLFIGSLVWGALFPQSHNLILPLAVVGHEGSTVLVILNGLRLLRGP